MNTLERRDRFLILLSVRRKVTMRELQQMFHVSRSTIQRDIDYLTPFACFYTQSGTNGGIIAVDGWHYKPTMLTPAMQKALQAILEGCEPDKEIIRGILAAFGKTGQEAGTMQEEL